MDPPSLCPHTFVSSLFCTLHLFSIAQLRDLRLRYSRGDCPLTVLRVHELLLPDLDLRDPQSPVTQMGAPLPSCHMRDTPVPLPHLSAAESFVLCWLG